MNQPLSKATADESVIIAVESLSVRYLGATILENINFEVKKGEIFIIVGGSGCGKSTLLRQLIGLEKPCSGKIWILNTELTSASAKAMFHMRMGIGVLFQSGALIGSMTLAENVSLPLREHTDLSPSSIREVVAMKLAIVNLTGYENHMPSELSGGMKKRAGIARALALDPKILFLDEPSTGLDPITSAELDVTIKRINEGLGTTIVIVNHDLDSIFNVSHRVIVLDKSVKGIIAEGDPLHLKEHSENQRVIHFFNRIPL